MAHSIQSVGMQSEVFNDLDLLVILCLLEETAQRQPSVDSAIQRVRQHWVDCRQLYAPGTIDLCLTELAGAPGGNAAFLSLLGEVESELGRFGNKIAAEILNTRCHVRGVRFHDYDVRFLQGALTRLRNLMDV